MKHIFLHIPKCSGTSMRYALNQDFEKDQIVQANVNQINDSRVARMNTPACKVIMGHLFYGLHEQIEDEVKYFTINLGRDRRQCRPL